MMHDLSGGISFELDCNAECPRSVFGRVGSTRFRRHALVSSRRQNDRHAAGEFSTGLVGSEWVRHHSYYRARSAPRCGFSRGPRAYRVRLC